MNKSQSHGMKCLARHNFKTVINKLFVFCETGPFANTVPSVTGISKQRVSGVFHMYTYLVCPSGFKTAFNKGYVPKTFQDTIMCDSVLACFSFSANTETKSVRRMPGNISFYGSLIIFHDSPDKGMIYPVYAMVKKLSRQTKLHFF